MLPGRWRRCVLCPVDDFDEVNEVLNEVLTDLRSLSFRYFCAVLLAEDDS